ncbi:MAG: hypothetical protein ACR2QJ_06010 [Geminicoccaceae bacterium]
MARKQWLTWSIALVLGGVGSTVIAADTTLSIQRPGPVYPLKLDEQDLVTNAEAVIPPQCYTRFFGKFNPCYTCHQTYDDRSRPNQMRDGRLQAAYNFSDAALTNHWSNLFLDRSKEIAAIDDAEILSWIESENYTSLRPRLEADGWSGWLPDLDNLHLADKAFDDQGFALDGSGWVAFNYKPLPSTFWPTNGSTDDVMIRLPEPFRQSEDGTPSRDVYMANLAALEMAIQDVDMVSTPAINELTLDTDLDGDGGLSIATMIQRPETYFGAASEVPLARMLYPEGTQFLHSVRYVGVEDDEIVVPARMKELRYMQKIRFYDPAQLRSLYDNERQKKTDELLPRFVNQGDRGLDGGMGWLIQGFIEDQTGELRPQSYEETAFCMGCHGTIGATIDQTFAFPRKVAGAAGWGYIDLKGMVDVPNVGETEGEILTYLRRAGGGNEFRENPEMQSRWFKGDDTVDADKVQSTDVYGLITPSVERALELNKAYKVIVDEQSYLFGRDAVLAPFTNVFDVIDDAKAPTLPKAFRAKWDIRLNWEGKGAS